MVNNTSWIVYTFLVVITWGVWGAFSAWPTTHYGYPDQWIYIIWSLTMLIPCYFALRGQRFDTSGTAILYGCLIGFTGAGGQLLLFKTLAMGAPAYLVFPIISISPAITVLMSLALLKERVNRLGGLGVLLALLSIVMFSISRGDGDRDGGLLWLLYSVVICAAWGVQAFFMKRASNLGVADSFAVWLYDADRDPAGAGCLADAGGQGRQLSVDGHAGYRVHSGIERRWRTLPGHGAVAR